MWPNQLQSNNPLYTWLNKLLGQSKANEILPSKDIRIARGPNGTQLAVNFPPTPFSDFFYPFKIYHVPRDKRKFRNDDDWQRIKVHDGIVRTDGNEQGGAQTEWTLLGSDGGGNLDRFAADYNIPTYQTPPNTSAAIVAGSWNEALIPDDDDTHHIYFSFIDAFHDPDLVYTHGLFVTGTADFSTDGTDGSATYLYNGNTCTPISYRGYTDVYNIKIGECTVSDGRLIIRQELFQHPLIVPDPTRPGRPRWRGAYDSNHTYYVGDMVYLDDNGSSTHDHRNIWIYYPPSSSSSYYPYNATFMGPMGPGNIISPLSGSPDPWFRLTRSPLATTGTDPAWTSGAYDGTKFYLRAT